MKQTDANVVEYLSAVNQFAEDNKTHKPKQQTAVEWLVEKTSTQDWHTYKSLEYIEQAKAMEKKQIMDAVDVGFEEGLKFPEDIKLNNAEQYYNETYGNRTENN